MGVLSGGAVSSITNWSGSAPPASRSCTPASTCARTASAWAASSAFDSAPSRSSSTRSKADTGTAKNYLNSQEIDTLNRITVMFLDQAEFRAQRRQTIQMADWGGFLDKFLADVELPILQGAGNTRRQQALKLAHQQYDQFAEKRRLEAEQQAEQNYVNELQATAKTAQW